LRSLYFPIPAALTIAVPASAAVQDGTTPTTVESTNRTLIQNAFDRWAKGEFDIFSLLADDASWHITGQDPEIARTYNSRQALLDATSLPLRARLVGPLKPVVRKIWANGDDVIVHWDGTAPFNDGSTYRNTYLWIMTVRHGRVVAVTAFLDNAAFKAALAKPAAPPEAKRE
jgi:ketosteroid isomerase-like protein